MKTNYESLSNLLEGSGVPASWQAVGKRGREGRVKEHEAPQKSLGDSMHSC